MISKYLLLIGLAALGTGCAGFVPSGQTANAAGRTTVERPRWAAADDATPASCTNQPYELVVTDELRHTRNELFVRTQGAARAHGRDALVRVGSDATVEAKFSYGKLAKDLQDEDVALHVRGLDCKWTHVSTVATDDRGIATFRVPAALLSKAGRYSFEAVLADGEAAPGVIYAIDGSTKAIVFDVDETLTTGNGELIEQLVLDDAPEMREDADDIVNAWARAGWFVAYVTGRPHQLTDITRKWLTANGFPQGLVRTSESLGVAMNGAATQRYKEGVLKELKTVGLDVEYAYGNAVTDICAYARASIDPMKTFILGPHAGVGCRGGKPTVALASYTEQLGVPILRLVDGLEPNAVATKLPPVSRDGVANAAEAQAAPAATTGPATGPRS